MSFLLTNTRTGEMKELLAPLHKKPRGRVKRVRSYGAPTPPNYGRSRHLQDTGLAALGDLAIALAGIFMAGTALAVPFLS